MWCAVVSRVNKQRVPRGQLALLVLTGLVGGTIAALAHFQSRDLIPLVAHDRSQGQPRRQVPTPVTDLSQQLLERWGPHVERTYGVPATNWRESMASTIEAASRAQVMNALLETEFDAMMRSLDAATQRPASNSIPPAAENDATATTARGLSYNTVVPCRVLDTRNNSGRINAWSFLDLHVTGSEFTVQGGAPHECGVPVTAAAVVVNITAIAPAGPGFLTAYPAGSARPPSSSLNYHSSDVRANELAVPLSEEAMPRITLYSNNAVDVAVDVVGYFATQPDDVMTCSRVSTYSTMSPGNYGAGFAECPQGLYGERWTQRMGGQCEWIMETAGQPEPGVLHPSVRSWNVMACDAENQSTVTRRFKITALCCDVRPSQ